MLNSEIVRRAHKMAKEIKAQYPEVNYKFQYGLCLSYILNGGNGMVDEFKAAKKYDQMEMLEKVMNEKGLDYSELGTTYKEVKNFESKRIEAYEKVLNYKAEAKKAIKGERMTNRQQDYLLSLINRYPEFAGLRKDVINFNMSKEEASKEINFILSETK